MEVATTARKESKGIVMQDVVTTRQLQTILKENLRHSTISPRLLVIKSIFFHQNIHSGMNNILLSGRTMKIGSLWVVCYDWLTTVGGVWKKSNFLWWVLRIACFYWVSTIAESWVLQNGWLGGPSRANIDRDQSLNIEHSGNMYRTLMNMWTLCKHSKNITWGYNKRTKHIWKTFIDLEWDADTLHLTDAVLYHAGALRTAVVEMLQFCSTLKPCHAGVWRTILVLVLRMVLGIKIWTECAAFAVLLSACNSFLSLSHTAHKLLQEQHTQNRTPFLRSAYLNQTLFVFTSFLVLSLVYGYYKPVSWWCCWKVW